MQMLCKFLINVSVVDMCFFLYFFNVCVVLVMLLLCKLFINVVCFS